MDGLNAPRREKDPGLAQVPRLELRSPLGTWGRFAMCWVSLSLVIWLIAVVAVRLARGESFVWNWFLLGAPVSWVISVAAAALVAGIVEFRRWLFGHSTWVRRAALFGAQRCWRVRCVLRSGWSTLLALYLISALAVVLRRIVIEDAVTARWFFAGAVGPWVQCIAFSALLAAVLEARHRGRQIVIASFSNVTGDNTYQSLADGLPRRLMTNLSDIAEIYEKVSEDPADLDLDEVAETPALSVESPTALSGLTASLADQKMGASFLKMPVNWIIDTLSTVVAGPRIIGSILRTADGLLIEASICGGVYKKTWRVKEQDVMANPTTKGSEAGSVDGMIRQLAYKVFTYLDHLQLGTLEWRAAERYTDGLRASLIAKREREGTGPRMIAVQSAQSAFFQAFREDARFARSRYNLGVMYYSARELRPAYEAFCSVINDFDHEAVPRLPGTRGFYNTRVELANVHYAAAKSAQGLGKDWRDRVLEHCRMALDLNPSLAPAWNLLGVCELEDAVARDSGYELSSSYFANAIGLSWNELCAVTWAGKQRSAVLSRTTIHLANMANSRFGSKRGRGIMEQALALDPTSETSWIDLGRLHLRVRDFAAALTAFETANREKDASTHWMWIACTRQLQGEEDAAKSAWNRAQKSLGDKLFEEDHIDQFWKDFERCSDSFGKQADRSVLGEWKKATLSLKVRVRDLKNAGEQLKSSTGRSVDVEIAAILPGRNLDDLIKMSDSDGESMLLLPYVAQRMLGDLSNKSQLEKTDPDRIEDVRNVVQRVVDAQPTGPLERSILARLYLLLQMPELAEAEVRNSLTLDPGNQDSRLLLCSAANTLRITVTDKEIRKRSMARIVGVFAEFEDVLTGYHQNSTGAGWAHFWRAVFSLEQLDYVAAQQGFETSHACGYQPFASLQWLCLVHFRCGAFEESERAFQRLKKLIAEMKPGEQVPAACDEGKDARLQLAFAASHSAAAAAEQGLIRFAFERWRESHQLTKSLLLQKLMSVEDAKGGAVAQLLCLGAICLNAGLGLAGSAISSAKRIAALHRAIYFLERTVERSTDSAVRADARYRIGVACAELARSARTSREQWLHLAEGQLREAESADRRDEYRSRIHDLRAMIKQTSA